MDALPYSTDDLARAALLRIVPGGYRLIDDNDPRFTGIRDRFVRLALKHLGGKPSLVGFVDPDVDASAAALALADWATRNLTPNAVQRRVQPGVLVVVVGAGPGTASGPVEGAAVPAAVWTVGPGARVEARGRPPGTPSPGLVRDVVARLERGEPAPGIGQVDYVERNLMYGRGGRARAAGLSGTAIILIILGVFFGLRFLPALLGPTARGQQAPNPCAQGCVTVTPQLQGSTLQMPIGAVQTFLFRGSSGCPPVTNPQVLRQQGCVRIQGGAEDGAAATYEAVAPGQALLQVTAGQQVYPITVVVQ